MGNLKDITLNFLEKIKVVELLLAENPQKTIKILNHYNIKKKMITYHESDWYRNKERVLSLLDQYETVGFISSAGSPNLEDPPINLVKFAIDNKIEIEIIPGASALCSAISLSPIPHTPFVFMGFLDKKNKYIKIFQETPSFVRSFIFFESCHRIRKSINLIKSFFPNNFILILHELTKINQKVIFSKISDIDEKNLTEKGEYTVILYTST
ncbi:MAG: SAM-dependent methyltransferase [bacterium]|nr:SAM-dependent methyltransferase [bacterium]